MTTRRQFLGYGAGLSFITLAQGAPGLLARAAAGAALADKNDHVLVVIELSGGNDGLNTLIPCEDPLYYKNRRTLGVPKKDVLRLADGLGLHPKMTAMQEMFKEGHLAMVQGVGYPGPNRSHFRSMEIWQTASVAPVAPSTGWLGRSLDGIPNPDDAHLHGLALTSGLPLAMQSETAFIPVVSQLEAISGEAENPAAKLRRELSTSANPTKGPVLPLRRQARTFYKAADRLKAATESASSGGEYPETELGLQLKRAAQIVSANLGVRVLYASQTGYDTHASQGETHGNLLEQLSTALAAFHKDLAARKLDKKVVVMAFSEFGRRVDENASKGTDHGAASCLIVAGSPVKGGSSANIPAWKP